MQVTDLVPTQTNPQRAVIDSRAAARAATLVLLQRAQHHVRCAHRTLEPFELSTRALLAPLEHLLRTNRSAKVQLLVDDPVWLETRAHRLRTLQRHFAHALELRVAAPDDPVGESAVLIGDQRDALQINSVLHCAGEIWLVNPRFTEPLAASFERRWNAGAHNLAVVPLGL